MMYNSADDLIQDFFGYKGKTEIFRIATVVGIFSDGGVKLRFDGEALPSGKKYARLAGYAPVAGNRVLTARIGNTDIILGKIEY